MLLSVVRTSWIAIWFSWERANTWLFPQTGQNGKCPQTGQNGQCTKNEGSTSSHAVLWKQAHFTQLT